MDGVVREVVGRDARASCCSDSGNTVIGGLKKRRKIYKNKDNEQSEDWRTVWVADQTMNVEMPKPFGMQYDGSSIAGGPRYDLKSLRGANDRKYDIECAQCRIRARRYPEIV
jgi:hypothetical protein